MKGFLLKNIRLKILAVVFATALWFFVGAQSTSEVGFLVPIALKGIPENMEIAGAPPGEIEVRVSGPGRTINTLSPSSVIAEIDLSGAKEGHNRVKITPQNITTPMGVEVVRLRPGSVDIRMEALRKASVPVKARLRGEPAGGYKVAAVNVSPAVVTVSGSSRAVKGLNAIYTSPVDISGLDSTKKFTVGLDVAAGEFRSLSADKATVRVSIIKAR